MRLGISLLNFRPGEVGGAETYLRQLVAHAPDLRGEDTIVVVADPTVAPLFAGAGVEVATLPFSPRRVIAERVLEAFSAYRSLAVERFFRGLRLDAVLFPQQSIFPKRIATPAALTIHDVQHLFFPQYFGLFDRLYRPAIYPYSMRHARRLIAISGYTRQTLTQHYRLSAEKIEVIHQGVKPVDPSRIEPLPDVPRPYLLYPATTQPHKNHATLLRSYATLRQRHATEAHLVFCGKKTRLWSRLQQMVDRLSIADRVHHFGFVELETVARLYRGCDAVVFPSQFEGFGLPVVEAVQFGCRVITSRLAVFDEIGVPRQWQIDFADADQLEAALRQPGPTKLEHPLQTWADTTRQTLDLLRRVAAEG